MVSDSNAEAVRLVDAWPAWHGGALALVGPAGSGKTHLAGAWGERVRAVDLSPAARVTDLQPLHGRPILLDNADRADAELLFHVINMAGEPGGGLLVTSRVAPSRWAADLPDLRSRLNALAVAEIGPPDDVILRGVLEKFFRERSIRPSEEVFAYLIRRIERSVPAAFDVVARLDEAAGEDHRAITRSLARQILDDEPETPDPPGSRLAPTDPSGENG